MSEAVHEVQHQAQHHIEHEHGHGAAHGKAPLENQNRKIALLIAVLALFLSFSETLGKSAQTRFIDLNIRASDTWNFFQAKTVRQTTLRTAAEALALEAPAISDNALKAQMEGQVDKWNATVKRYDSDPKEKDGRKELRAQAELYERDRDVAVAAYHNYELGSAAYQIGIVLASAAVITGMIALAYAAGGLGVIGLIFTGLGLLAPELPHELVHSFSHLFAAGAVH
jgi:hypothetical protein